MDSSFPYVHVDPEAERDAPEAYRELEADLPFFTVARIDHRKMLVVDGHTAIIGGQNIGQEYLYREPFDPELPAEQEPWHKWHDVAVELRGPVVRDLQKLFRERWVAEGGDLFSMGPSELGHGLDPEHPTFPALAPLPTGVPVQIVRTTPGAQHEFHAELLSHIDRAEREILLSNPYLASKELVRHLVAARSRGVRVLYIFPDEHNDSWEFLYNARLRYAALIEAGIEVYEYQHRMTHAKVAVIDDATIIGSPNLNHSSFFNHYEVAAIIADAGFTASFRKALFEVDLVRSVRIAPEDIEALLDITPVARAYLNLVVDRFF